MKKILVFAGVAMVGAVLLGAQFDRDRVIAGGGIFVQGWTGKIDAGSVRQGRSLNDAKFAQDGNALHVTTGPATTFWNPANVASGDYTVKATFLEPKFMELNSHAHSYGIVIGGSNMGTDQMSYVYCVAYGDGNALVSGFRAPMSSRSSGPHRMRPFTRPPAWASPSRRRFSGA